MYNGNFVFSLNQTSSMPPPPKNKKMFGAAADPLPSPMCGAEAREMW